MCFPLAVVCHNTKLTNDEIHKISRIIGSDWDSLAGLLNIPFGEREEVRLNYAKYPDFPSKAEKVLYRFNNSDRFGRDILEKCLDEMRRGDLRRELLPLQRKVLNSYRVI